MPGLNIIVRDQEFVLASCDTVLQGKQPLIRKASSLVACVVKHGTAPAPSRLPRRPAVQELGSYQSRPYQASLTLKPRARKYASLTSLG